MSSLLRWAIPHDSGYPRLSLVFPIFLVFFSLFLLRDAQSDAGGDVTSLSVKQGDVLSLPFKTEGNALSVVGTWKGRAVPFFTGKDPDLFSTLLGIDLEETPSIQDFLIDIAYENGSRKTMTYHIHIVASSFGVQELTLPQEMVDLDEPTLRRVEEEQELVKKVLSPLGTSRLWDGNFLVPLKGEITGRFGQRRILNGQPRNPHSGEDITAPLGTEVRAANTGVVRMVADMFFSGKSVIIDHGLGVYTMYFHLSEVTVKEGGVIKKGDVLGLVGKTGRATGSHLHWGARVGGARVNPFSLVGVSLE